MRRSRKRMEKVENAFFMDITCYPQWYNASDTTVDRDYVEEDTMRKRKYIF